MKYFIDVCGRKIKVNDIVAFIDNAEIGIAQIVEISGDTLIAQPFLYGEDSYVSINKLLASEYKLDPYNLTWTDSKYTKKGILILKRKHEIK